MIAVLDIADQLDGQEPVNPCSLIRKLSPACCLICEGGTIQSGLKVIQIPASSPPLHALVFNVKTERLTCHEDSYTGIT